MVMVLPAVASPSPSAHQTLSGVTIDVCSAPELHEEVIEITESDDDDDDESCHYLLPVETFFFGGQTYFGELSLEHKHVHTPFHLRAFSNRGSPVA